MKFNRHKDNSETFTVPADNEKNGKVQTNPEDLWVVIFRGIPRAGKTTLAKVLHHKLEDKYRIALIHYDNIFEMSIGEEKKRLKPKIATGLIKDLLIEDFNLILDYSFVFTQDLKQTIQLIEKHASRYQIYLLKPSFLEIIERDKRFPVPKGIESLKEFRVAMENNNFPGDLEIDTGRLSVDECIELILNNMWSNGLWYCQSKGRKTSYGKSSTLVQEEVLTF